MATMKDRCFQDIVLSFLDEADAEQIPWRISRSLDMLREECGAPNADLSGRPRSQDQATETRVGLASPQVECGADSSQEPVQFQQQY
eukprot:c21120_g1_i2 orf=165-425(+)